MDSIINVKLIHFSVQEIPKLLEEGYKICGKSGHLMTISFHSI